VPYAKSLAQCRGILHSGPSSVAVVFSSGIPHPHLLGDCTEHFFSKNTWGDLQTEFVSRITNYELPTTNS
jgi:hypothetical protein